jgi:periplasmic divalent cation tolerance protein
MKIILIYVTNENEMQAQLLADHLLKARLVACANIFPIKSSYWWQENLENDSEYVSLFKTREEYWDLVREKIEKIHPYDVPCIIKIVADANDSYKNWIYQETEPGS